MTRQTDKVFWQEEARKIGGHELVQVIEAMAEDIHAIKADMARFMKAFPNDDIDGHREYHKIMIERNRNMRDLTLEIRKKTVVGVLWMLLAGVGIAVWHEIIDLVSRSN